VDQKTKAITENLLNVHWACTLSPRIATWYACSKNLNLF